MKAKDTKIRRFAWASLIVVSVLILGFIYLKGVHRPKAERYTSQGIPAAEVTPLPGLPEDWLLNSGDIKALDALPGIGEVIAGRIIEVREQEGLFYFPEDIMDVKGIGEKRFEGIMEWLEEQAGMESDLSD